MTSSSVPFDGWAEYYDLIHDGLPGDIAFYLRHALEARGPVLELGVGTGRIAIPAAFEGAEIVGIDNSAGMLAICRAKLDSVGPVPGRLSLIRGDMARFAFNARFSCILMPYRTFMHLLTPGDQERCLRRVRAHLADDGVFILNTWAPDARILRSLAGTKSSRRRLAGRYDLPEDAMSICHYHSSRADLSRQWLHEDHWIQELDDGGAITREVRLPMLRAWTTPRQFRQLVRQCGFAIREELGDFSEKPFGKASSELICVLQRSQTR